MVICHDCLESTVCSALFKLFLIYEILQRFYNHSWNSLTISLKDRIVQIFFSAMLGLRELKNCWTCLASYLRKQPSVFSKLTQVKSLVLSSELWKILTLPMPQLINMFFCHWYLRCLLMFPQLKLNETIKFNTYESFWIKRHFLSPNDQYYMLFVRFVAFMRIYG